MLPVLLPGVQVLMGNAGFCFYCELRISRPFTKKRRENRFYGLAMAGIISMGMP
jgi:hypothetical protein